MHSIRFERLAFGYSDSVPLVIDVDAHLGAGFTGIVGPNGAGKSTLLRLVAGELRPTAGSIELPAGALVATCPQTIDACPRLARELADRDDGAAGRLRSMLAIEPAELDRWPTLSPGERRRWQIGGALAAEPDVLLLDEPTNHVDARCRALLVGALRRFAGIGLVVAHDRALLDELTVATVRVDHGRAELFPCAYSAAKALWEANDQRASDVRAEARRVAKHAEARLAAVRRDQAAADANRKTARRMKTPRDHDATSMGRKVVAGWAEDRLGRSVEVARRDAERAASAIPDATAGKPFGRSIFLGYERAPRRWLFELDEAVIRAGDAEVLRDVHLAVGATDRIHIAGDNGAGKTTLVRALLASRGLATDALVLPTGDQRILALPQELASGAGAELVRALRATPSDGRGRTLQLVAALGADPDRVLATSSPSPGEARKLALALGLAHHAWGVVLDEPTNHFDLPSIERLEQALAAFPGAIVVVSHDDAFARRIAATTWRIHHATVER